MGMVFLNILFYIAAPVFVLSAFVFLISSFAIACTRIGKKGSQKSTATLIQTTRSTVLNAAQFWKPALKCALILMLISAALVTYALPRTEAEGQLNLMTTTIGQLSDEIKAVAEEAPTALIYTESIGAPGTFTVAVDDPALAKTALDIILSAAVDRRGCQVDMCQYRHEEYCFTFGEETCTFDFVPDSYFCYDGQYYELEKNHLDEVRDYLHELTAKAETAVEPQSKWYSDDAVLETHFWDNGDEARSLTELTLSAGGETLTGVIEGAYDVLSIDKQPDGYVIRYTYGDFYSHEAVRSSRVTVENGEMVITAE